MEKEVVSWEANCTGEIVELPPEKRAISSKLAYESRFKPDGSIERFKAWFVERGFDQT